MSGRWLRLYDDTINDPKVLSLSEATRWHWIAILCIASKNDGALPEIKRVAIQMRLSPQRVAAVIAELVSAELLDKTETGFAPHNWNGRQYKSDVSTDRVKRFRNAQRNATPAVSETAPETEADTETEPEKNKARVPRSRSLPDPWVEGDWQRFYAAYPNKVGKPEAQKAFAKAVHRTTPDELFAGLDRYLSKTDDRPWCNPATWLNQDRWNDKPAVATGPPRAFRAATQGFESLLQNGFANDHPATDPGFDLDLTANPANRPALGQRG